MRTFDMALGRTALSTVIAALTWIGLSALANAQEAKYQRYGWWHNRDRVSLAEKTAKEASTPEGRALIAAIAIYAGIDPSTVDAAVTTAAAFIVSNDKGNELSGLIQTEVGYTICYAKPISDNIGAGEHGIETHKSTFNTSIMRVTPSTGQNFDGLGWYMDLPRSRDLDHRVHTDFDVVFVKADIPGIMEKYKCRPTGEHPWLATNNHTTLNAKCTVPANCPGG